MLGPEFRSERLKGCSGCPPFHAPSRGDPVARNNDLDVVRSRQRYEVVVVRVAADTNTFASMTTNTGAEPINSWTATAYGSNLIDRKIDSIVLGKGDVGVDVGGQCGSCLCGETLPG